MRSGWPFRPPTRSIYHPNSVSSPKTASQTDSLPAELAESPLDIAAIRTEFPILNQQVHGHRLVYLDSAASAQRPAAVIRTVAEYYAKDHANVHRGAYELSVRATRRYEAARGKVARFLGAGRADEVVFTRSTTESINLVSTAWGGANLGPGDVVVVSEMEHHSNLVPWQMVCEATGAEIKAIRVTDDQCLDLDHLDILLGEGDVRLVATGHVRPPPSCRSMCARSTVTSTPSVATRRAVQRGSGRCGRGASCSSRCLPIREVAK